MKNDMIKIGYYPFNNDTNAFVKISKAAIASIGYEVTDANIKVTKFHFINNKCVILNWFEGLNNDRFKKIKDYILKSCYLFVCLIFRIKIVSVFHNRKPHNSKMSALQYRMIRKLFEKSDKIIILSKQSTQYIKEFKVKDVVEKCFYIPHPNYIGAYGEYVGEKIFDVNKLKILFFGSVSPYKNIELIIEVAKKIKNENVEFYIVGKPSDKFYAEHLLNICQNESNIHLILKFIDDIEVAKYISNCDIMILPYDNSSLNSGTAILAFSFAKTVICPDISTVNDYNKKNMYIYSYENDDEHLSVLIETCQKVISDFEKNSRIISYKGESMKQEVIKKNSFEIVCKRYNELLKKLV